MSNARQQYAKSRLKDRAVREHCGECIVYAFPYVRILSVISANWTTAYVRCWNPIRLFRVWNYLYQISRYLQIRRRNISITFFFSRLRDLYSILLLIIEYKVNIYSYICCL